jgi:hypothetical protein
VEQSQNVHRRAWAEEDERAAHSWSRQIAYERENRSPNDFVYTRGSFAIANVTVEAIEFVRISISPAFGRSFVLAESRANSPVRRRMAEMKTMAIRRKDRPPGTGTGGELLDGTGSSMVGRCQRSCEDGRVTGDTPKHRTSLSGVVATTRAG